MADIDLILDRLETIIELLRQQVNTSLTNKNPKPHFTLENGKRLPHMHEQIAEGLTACGRTLLNGTYLMTTDISLVTCGLCNRKRDLEQKRLSKRQIINILAGLRDLDQNDRKAQDSDNATAGTFINQPLGRSSEPFTITGSFEDYEDEDDEG